MLPTAGGKKTETGEKDLRTTEHESRKCNEGRGGFCFVTFNKLKAAFVENGII